MTNGEITNGMVAENLQSAKKNKKIEDVLIIINFMGVNISEAENIGGIGIDILGIAARKMHYMFRDIPKKDYGIDGEIEILKNGKQLAHKYQVQVKTGKKFKVRGDGFLKISPIKREHLEYWCEHINIPVFIFAVEETSQNVFWIDPQPYFKKIQQKKKNKTIIIHADTKDIFTEKNRARFLSFLRNLEDESSSRVRKRVSKKDKYRIAAREKGYTVVERNIDDDTLGTPILSVGFEKDILDFFPSKNSHKNPVSIRAFFNESTSQDEIQNNKATNVKVLIGEEVLEEIPSADITISPVKQKMKIRIFSNSKNKSYFVKIRAWFQNQYINLESHDEEPITIKACIDINKKDKTFSLEINTAAISSLDKYLDVIDFFSTATEDLAFYFIDNSGNEFLFGEATNINHMQNSEFLYFIKKMIKVEKKYSVSFDLKKIISADIDQSTLVKYIAEALLNNEVIAEGFTISADMVLDEGRSLPKNKDYARLQYSEEISLFGEKINLNNKTLQIDGKSTFKKTKEGYKCMIKDPKIHLS